MQFDPITELSYMAYCNARNRHPLLRASELNALFPDRAREFEQRYQREQMGWQRMEESYLEARVE